MKYSIMEFRHGVFCVFTAISLCSSVVSRYTSHLENDIILPVRNYLLPNEWESMCNIRDTTQSDVHVQCSVDSKHSGKWRLDTLRDWISFSNVSYHFDVQCTGRSNVSISWPIKAKNLVDLKVTGCFIMNFLSNLEFGNVLSETVDQLISLQLVDSIIFLGFEEFMYYTINVKNLSKDFICGHEDTLKDVVMRNISYHVKDSVYVTNDTVNNQMLYLDKQLIEDYRKITYKCNFKNLKFIDQSISTSRSKYHIDLMTQKSLYDEVSIYNLSHTCKININSHFKEWWIYFPKLEVLDLSHNYISSFELDSTAFAWETPAVLHMNLSHNKFIRITTDYIHQLVGIKNLKINLESNPFHCGCSPEMEKVVHLIQNPGIWENTDYSRYKDLRYLKCATPESARGKPFISLTKNDMSCKIISRVPVIILSSLVVFLVVVIIIITPYRRKIQNIIFPRFRTVLPSRPHEMYHDQTSGEFVSSSSENDVRVRKAFHALETEEHRKGPIFYIILPSPERIPCRKNCLLMSSTV